MKRYALTFTLIDSKVHIVALKEGDFFLLPDSSALSEFSLEIDGTFCDVFFIDKKMENTYELMSIANMEELSSRFVFLALAKLFPYMPNSWNVDTKYLPSSLYKGMFEEITFYGGSFNPWHEGHSECLRQCPNENIVIVPDANPWKEDQSHLHSTWSLFLEIVSKFKNSTYSIYPGFWGIMKKNPTVQWLPSVACQKKNLLIGDDNFMAFDKWTNFETLMKSLHTLYVVPRQFEIVELEKKRSELESLNLDVQIILLNSHEYQSLSSTEIRKNLLKN
ncbi:hypothetical protein HBN50_10725 [Halobacteriovorax sp. GB3]|uniref:hypothetical protein n=1 Tax=Halobacteriovorax sp. GB3 TaxID=2719615 RepID=UPI00235F0F2F|nr:hypothetical protein [Halobacteriovorax sp. GB3]MDD0853576.1 hypothetical protein [Halobacteriovorax sp. GB3]